MANNRIGNMLGVVDKRSKVHTGEQHLRTTRGVNEFTANAAGTTTTIVGADPASGAGLRIGDKFKLFTSAGVLKEETVFRVTAASSATGSTTYTFTPAAAAATASTNTARLVSYTDYKDMESIDRRLTAISSTTYSAERLRVMSLNDKLYALRSADDSAGRN